MKILLTVHQFYPESSSGTETLTLDTAKELMRRGHEVRIFTGFHTKQPMGDSSRFDSYEYHGLHIDRFYHHRVPMGGQRNIAEAEYNNTFFGEYFRAYLKQHNPDLVHFFHLHRMSASMIDACCESGVPTVMTPTDFWLVCPTFQLLLPDNTLCAGPDADGVNCLRHVVLLSQPAPVNSAVSLLPNRAVAFAINMIKQAAPISEGVWSYVQALSQRQEFLRDRFKKLDRVIVPSRHLERILTENGFTSEKVVVSPYGIDLSHGYREKLRDERSGTLRLGFIGSLLRHKGAHVLAQALALLPRDEPIEVKIYGNMDENPIYVNELKRMVGDDPRVAFCGTFPNRKIGDILAAIDVLVVPSIWYENTPLVIYSAQAAGCPVIASNLGGMAEVVRHNENGLLFTHGNAAELAACVQQFVRKRDLVSKLSAATKPKSISAYVSELLQTYEDLVKHKWGERCAV